MKRYPLFFLLLLALMLSACQGQPTAEKRDLRLVMLSEPCTLDPRLAADFSSRCVIMMLGEGLTRIGPDGEVQLALAESMEVSPDQQRYTFKIRNAAWSNADPITAHDFVKTWHSCLDPQFPGPFVHLFYLIKGGKEARRGLIPADKTGIYAPDAQTLVVELEHPAPYFPELLAATFFYPLHSLARLGKGTKNTPTPTNGPFRIETWQPNKKLTLGRSLTYWDKQSVELEGISMAIVPSELSALQLYEKGELDWIGAPLSSLPLDALPMLQQKNVLHSQPITGIYWYKLNTDHPLLSSAKIRRALSYAIDRERISAYIFAGTQPSASSYTTPGHKPMYDPVEAKKLYHEGLEELGLHSGTVGPLELSFNNRENHLRIASAIQQEWLKTLGIRVHLSTQEWPVFFNKVRNRDFEVCRFAWLSNFADPIDVLQVFRYPNTVEGGWVNDTGWYDKDYCALIEQINQTTDPDERCLFYQQAENILLDAMPAIPLFFVTYNYLQPPNLKGICFSQSGFVDFKLAFFTN